MNYDVELAALLPEAPDEHDQCVARLFAALEALPGVSEVHILPAQTDHARRVCLHFDDSRVSLAKVRLVAERTGAQISDRYGHLVLTTSPFGHPRRADAMAGRVARLPGVLTAFASADGVLRIEYDRERTDQDAVRVAIQRLGIHTPPPDEPAEVGAQPDSDHDHGHGQSELWVAVLAFALYLAGQGLEWFTDSSAPSKQLFVASILLAGAPTLRDVYHAVRARRMEIDTLMIFAAGGAVALGEFGDAALLLCLFGIGHGLEGFAMSRARHAIEALGALAPDTAVVRRTDGTEATLPVSELAVGDLVIVRPNERIPADGLVVAGTSSVDQSSITGESVPVDKAAASDDVVSNPRLASANNQVFAGSINGPGALDIRVQALAADSTLARVVRLVTEAETHASPTQRWTQRFERIFVPVVLVMVVALLVVGAFIDDTYSHTFYRAMAVLVAASPCALAIATPSAVLAAVARAGRNGVLIKGGAPLEQLGRIQAIAFDKTGTLTVGAPRLTDVEPASLVSRQELLRVAVAVESQSDHPLARAIVSDAKEELGSTRLTATDVSSVTGKGITGTVGTARVMIGNRALFEQDGGSLAQDVADTAALLEGRGRSTMIVRSDGQFLGVLGVMDQPRQEAPAVIARLREIGVRKMVMLSGDSARVATAVGATVGLDDARGGLLPEDKVTAIRNLVASQPTAMVGDGVNDAPALATATVGIAMGAAGSDVALETADVALMGDDLHTIPFVVGLSRRTGRIIRQNLYISLGIVSVLIPTTMFGIARIGPAVILHEGSTLIVVANALRLLRFKDRWFDRARAGRDVSVPAER